MLHLWLGSATAGIILAPLVVLHRFAALIVPFGRFATLLADEPTLGLSRARRGC